LIVLPSSGVYNPTWTDLIDLVTVEGLTVNDAIAIVGGGLQLSDSDDTTYVDTAVPTTPGDGYLPAEGITTPQYAAAVDFPATVVDPATTVISMQARTQWTTHPDWPTAILYNRATGLRIFSNMRWTFYETADVPTTSTLAFSPADGMIEAELTDFTDTIAAGDLSILLMTQFGSSDGMDIIRWYELAISWPDAVAVKPYVCRIHPGFHP